MKNSPTATACGIILMWRRGVFVCLLRLLFGGALIMCVPRLTALCSETLKRRYWSPSSPRHPGGQNAFVVPTDTARPCGSKSATRGRANIKSGGTDGYRTSAVTCSGGLQLFHLEDISPAVSNDTVTHAQRRISDLHSVVGSGGGNGELIFGRGGAGFGFGTFCDINLSPFGNNNHCVRIHRPLIEGDWQDERRRLTEGEEFNLKFAESCGDLANSQLTALLHVSENVFPNSVKSVGGDDGGLSAKYGSPIGHEARDSATDRRTSQPTVKVLTMVTRTPYHTSGDISREYGGIGEDYLPRTALVWEPNPYDGSLECGDRQVHDYPDAEHLAISLASNDVHLVVVAPPSVESIYRSFVHQLVKMKVKASFRLTDDETIMEGTKEIMSGLLALGVCQYQRVLHERDDTTVEIPAIHSTAIKKWLMAVGVGTLAILVAMTCWFWRYYSIVIEARECCDMDTTAGPD